MISGCNVCIIIILHFNWCKFWVTLYHFIFSADLLHEAGYFYSISQGSELTVTFVPIPKQNELEDKAQTISTAMKLIEKRELDVILLYTEKENLELFLKQVRAPPPNSCSCSCHSSSWLR